MKNKGTEVTEQQTAPRVGRKRRTVRLSTTILIAIIIGSVGFAGGMRATELTIQLSNSQNKGAPSKLDFSSVQAVYDKIRQEYDGKLDTTKLIDGAKKGMVEATGDPYTVFFTDSEASQFLGDLEGKFSGIGAELDKRNNQLVITSTIDDSPARKSGLLAGDSILKVNDEDAASWSVEQAVSKIRGDKGTTVKLGIARDSKLQEFSIVRDEIVTPSVTYSEDGDNIGYMRISRFAEGDTATLAQKAAQEFKDKGVKGVVLDLRGNGGGYLTAAQDIASLWLRDKVVVQERRGDVVQETLRSGNDPVLEGVPTVVLVDGGSASASEIVAGALSDNGAAKLVGVKTFGKGSVQQIVSIPSGGELKVTVAKWYTPKGKNINKEGITPDVVMSLSDDDLKSGRDPQKDKALSLVKDQ
jgi:carboxyl-terminal processing protease